MRTFCLVVMAQCCAAMTGCLVVPIPANPFPMAADQRPADQIALLPILPGDLTIDRLPAIAFGSQDENRRIPTPWEDAKLVKDCDSTFDTIAAGKQNTLIGPTRQGQDLTEARWQEWLSIPAGEASPSADALAALQESARKLGVRYLVRFRPHITLHHDGACGLPVGAPVGLAFWYGKVVMTAELWDPSTGRCIASRSAEGSFWGSFGNFPCILCGHAVWKSFCRATDQASRQALAELFKELPAASRS